MAIDVPRLRDLLASASPGPWEACGCGKCGLVWSRSLDSAILTRIYGDTVIRPHPKDVAAWKAEHPDEPLPEEYAKYPEVDFYPADDWATFNAHNSTLVAEAVSALPELLDELERLRAEVQQRNPTTAAEIPDRA